jgi:Protein of unknown function (DUF3500)
MKKVGALAVALAASVLLVGGYWSGARQAQAALKDDARTRTQAIVAATNAFVSSLDATQRAKVLFGYSLQQSATAAKFKGGMDGRMTFVGEQYGQSVWSNYPVSDVPRPGVALGELSPVQRDAAMKLLQTALSAKGYQKVIDIMGADQVLANGGTNYASGTAYYTLGIFGTPSDKTPWMLQFGGHHLGLNITLNGERGVMTPTLTGAQPAVYTRDGRTVRALAEESDKAFALIDALDETQRKQAILNYRVADLVLGPGHEDEVIPPEGLKASAMNTKQKKMLLDVIAEWSGIISSPYAEARVEEVRAGLEDTYFAWSGPTTHEPGKNGAAYYRIVGPKLVIEFSPQGTGGDPTMHVHTVYRDPSNDYGRAVLK